MSDIKKLKGRVDALEKRYQTSVQLAAQMKELNKWVEGNSLTSQIVHQMAVTVSLITKQLNITPEDIANEQDRIKKLVEEKKAKFDSVEADKQHGSVQP